MRIYAIPLNLVSTHLAAGISKTIIFFPRYSILRNSNSKSPVILVSQGIKSSFEPFSLQLNGSNDVPTTLKVPSSIPQKIYALFSSKSAAEFDNADIYLPNISLSNKFVLYSIISDSLTLLEMSPSKIPIISLSSICMILPPAVTLCNIPVTSSFHNF